MNAWKRMGEVLTSARREHDAPTVNTGSKYPPLPSAEDRLLEEALNIGSSAEGLGHAIGQSLVRRYGLRRAYDVADAISRGIAAGARR